MGTKKLLIIGAGGHGRVVADIARRMDIYSEISFADDNAQADTGAYSLIGNVSDAEKCLSEYEVFVAIGNSLARKNIALALLAKGATMPVLIHPFSCVAENVSIGRGTVVVPGAVINTGTQIGMGVIINTSSSVGHDCIVNDFSHVAPGVRVCGGTQIGSNVWVGAGSTIINNIKICDNVFIAAGTVVVKDIQIPGLYKGMPAKLDKIYV